MITLEDDINFFSSMLNDLISQEQQIDQLSLAMKKGLRKCCIPIEEETPILDQAAVDAKLSEELLSEIELALSKAHLAYDASRPDRKRASKQAVEKAPIKIEKKPPLSENQKRITGDKRPASHRTNFRPAHQTAPFQTFTERAKSARRKSRTTDVRKRAQSWIEGTGTPATLVTADQNTNAGKNSNSKSTVPPLPWIGNSASIASYAPETQLEPVSRIRPLPDVGYRLTDEANKRLEELKEYAKSFQQYASVSADNPSCEARDQLLNFMRSLGADNMQTVELGRAFFTCSLPELISSIEEFKKICGIIDWEEATDSQRKWRLEMTAHFQDLCSLAEQAKPMLLLPDDETSKEVVTDYSSSFQDAVPSLNDVWKTYVCSGNSVNDETGGIPRSQLLAQGPVVFPAKTKLTDLMHLAATWETIFQLQRRLTKLAYIDQRLPDWLAQLQSQQSEKASTFRLICALACGRPPVTLVNESLL